MFNILSLKIIEPSTSSLLIWDETTNQIKQVKSNQIKSNQIKIILVLRGDLLEQRRQQINSTHI